MALDLSIKKARSQLLGRRYRPDFSVPPVPYVSQEEKEMSEGEEGFFLFVCFVLFLFLFLPQFETNRMQQSYKVSGEWRT